MPRRGDADPLLLQAVSERLAHLLAETPPRRAAGPGPAADGSTTAPPARDQAGTSWLDAPDTRLVDVEDVPPPRRFGRRHLAVVAALLALALLWAGWSVLRARPVALAAPTGASVSAPPSSSAAGGPGSPSPGPSPSATASPSTPGPPGGAVVVHVLGAVRRPGLVRLGERARVQEAVDAAGGFTRDADAGDLNLAQVLQDGQQVVIGTRADPAGEVRGGPAGAGSGAPGSGSGSGSGAPAAVLDLNAATETQLEELPGIGPVTAGKVVAWRTEHGRFTRVDELQEVDGIGPKTFAEIAPHVRV